MSSRTRAGSERTHSSISASVRRKLGGDHLSSCAEYSRSASSPRAAMFSSIDSTVCRTCRAVSDFVSAVRPVLMRLTIAYLSQSSKRQCQQKEQPPETHELESRAGLLRVEA